MFITITMKITNKPVEETFEEVRKMLEIRSAEIHDNIANSA